MKPTRDFLPIEIISYHPLHGPENSRRKFTETTVRAVPSGMGDLPQIVGGVTEVERIEGTKDWEGVLSPGA
jgi:hypothetical protein